MKKIILTTIVFSLFSFMGCDKNNTNSEADEKVEILNTPKKENIFTGFTNNLGKITLIGNYGIREIELDEKAQQYYPNLIQLRVYDGIRDPQSRRSWTDEQSFLKSNELDTTLLINDRTNFLTDVIYFARVMSEEKELPNLIFSNYQKTDSTQKLTMKIESLDLTINGKFKTSEIDTVLNFLKARYPGIQKKSAEKLSLIHLMEGKLIALAIRHNYDLGFKGQISPDAHYKMYNSKEAFFIIGKYHGGGIGIETYAISSDVPCTAQNIMKFPWLYLEKDLNRRYLYNLGKDRSWAFGDMIEMRKEISL